jgi:hypothetical protein
MLLPQQPFCQHKQQTQPLKLKYNKRDAYQINTKYKPNNKGYLTT